MERQLFTWTGWDGDQECMVFYNPTLVVQVGKYPAGTKFDYATLMNDKGILQLGNHGREKVGNYYPSVVMGEYKLTLGVGDTINEPV